MPPKVRRANSGQRAGLTVGNRYCCKNCILVKMALRLDNTTILANEYKLFFPSADELAMNLSKYVEMPGRLD